MSLTLRCQECGSTKLEIRLSVQQAYQATLNPKTGKYDLGAFRVSRGEKHRLLDNPWIVCLACGREHEAEDTALDFLLSQELLEFFDNRGG